MNIIRGRGRGERERERERGGGGRERERVSTDQLTYRVVQSAVHFSCENISHKLDGVVDDSVHLGHTAHRVGVLDTPTVFVAL